jgi:hypothetical protein
VDAADADGRVDADVPAETGEDAAPEASDDAGVPPDVPGDAETVEPDDDADTVEPDEGVPEIFPDGGPTCDPPPPMPVMLEFTVDGETHADVDLETPCRVASVTGEAVGHVIVTLECGTGGMMEHHTIDVAASADLALGFLDGQEVTFRYVSDPIWWVDRWFTIRSRAGLLLVAAVDASGVAPRDVEASEWYAPVGVRAVGGVCPPAPDRCGPVERQGIEVVFGGETDLVFDGYATDVGGLASVFVFVALATHYLEMTCDDVPDQFYRAIIVLTPEG